MRAKLDHVPVVHVWTAFRDGIRVCYSDSYISYICIFLVYQDWQASVTCPEESDMPHEVLRKERAHLRQNSIFDGT
jgi:hypothetical protein